VRRMAPRRFDLVLLLDVVEHIPRSELAALLREMHRLLQTKALLVINTPVFGADNDVLAEGLNPRARDESDDFTETSGMHCNRYTRASLRRFMKDCGYRAIGGHYFVNRVMTPPVAEFLGLAWRRAYQAGYPLRSPRKPPETFDVAYSTRQHERLRRLYASNRVVKSIGLKLLPLLWRWGIRQ